MNASVCPSMKRGWSAQRPQREAERDVRRHVVAFDRWSGGLGLGHAEAAHCLGMAPGSLAFWAHRWRRQRLPARPLGRPCRRSDPRVRNEAIGLMHCVGLEINMAAVQASFPAMARREVQNLHARFRHHCGQEGQRLLHVLHWHRPGAVWATDHVEPARPIDGRWPYLLAVRDLGERRPACLAAGAGRDVGLDDRGPPVAVAGTWATAGAEVRQRIGLRGPAHAWSFLERWQVLPLFSPPYTPEYNGACEAGHDAMKLAYEHARGPGGPRGLLDGRRLRSGASHGQRAALPAWPVPADAPGDLYDPGAD